MIKFDTNYEELPAFTKIPGWLQVYNKDICWKAEDAGRNIYLTFDDGPHPVVTPYILDVLNEYNIKASFFCIGSNVEKHPDIYKRIIKEGHATGNHSYSHKSGWKTTVDEYISDVSSAAKLIDSKLFRPPFGRITPGQFRVLKNQYRIVMWNVLSKDYDSSINDVQVIKNATNDLSPGSIIVMHDNDKTVERMSFILPEIISSIKRQGWSFKSL